jgi:molybdenum cofactor cytidylyltransferase
MHVAGILLAAGVGRRYDPTGARLKLIEPAPAGPQAGTPIAVAALRNLRASIDEVVVVVRAADDDLQRRLHELLTAEGACLVVCADAAAGMGHSLACGARELSAAGGWLIALADMPSVSPRTIEAVRDAIVRGHDAAVPAHRGQPGHPVGFGHACRDELIALTGDRGARSVLQRHPPLTIDVDDPGCLLDIDTADR